MTVAIDMIVEEVSEPIRYNLNSQHTHIETGEGKSMMYLFRFSLEAKARVFHEHERFYKVPRIAVKESYSLTLQVLFPSL